MVWERDTGKVNFFWEEGEEVTDWNGELDTPPVISVIVREE